MINLATAISGPSEEIKQANKTLEDANRTAQEIVALDTGRRSCCSGGYGCGIRPAFDVRREKRLLRNVAVRGPKLPVCGTYCAGVAELADAPGPDFPQ